MVASIRFIQSWFTQGMLVLFAVAIAPHLNVTAVIRSGTKPRNRMEGWVFNPEYYPHFLFDA